MRNVLITGASRGIGAETARIFAQGGDRVFINYSKSENAAASLQKELSECGHYAVSIKADVSSSREVNEMFERISREYGGIDVLVNNAGISQTKLFTDITDDDWNTMISTNLSGVFYCCRAALPYMIRKHHGRIINISSMWGQVGGSCEVHYSAAKAGIIGLTKAKSRIFSCIRFILIHNWSDAWSKRRFCRQLIQCHRNQLTFLKKHTIIKTDKAADRLRLVPKKSTTDLK